MKPTCMCSQIPTVIIFLCLPTNAREELKADFFLPSWRAFLQRFPPSQPLCTFRFQTKLVLIIKVDEQVDCEVKLRSLCCSAYATVPSPGRWMEAANQWAHVCRRPWATSTCVFLSTAYRCLYYSHGCYTCSGELSGIKNNNPKNRYSV